MIAWVQCTRCQREVITYDRKARKRFCRGCRTKQRQAPRSANAKLAVDDVRAIRKRREAGELVRILAEDYGVSTCTISRIAHRLGYRYVTDN